VLTTLLDVNVLLALAWPNHVHHQVAQRWFSQRSGAWATCAITEIGFVRNSANKTAIPQAATPPQAVEILRRLRSMDRHTFWVDDIELVVDERIQASRLGGYRQLTDAHLIALAERHGGAVATFDRGLLSLIDKRSSKLVEVINPRQ
jgi:uncharacterized protein